MNIDQIRKIVNGGYSDVQARHLIISVLSEDEEAIPLMMEILDYERKRRKKLLSSMNLELSRAHLTIEKPEINKDNFVFNEIVKFYKKNKDQIGHCFANMDNYKEPNDDEDKLSWT